MHPPKRHHMHLRPSRFETQLMNIRNQLPVPNSVYGPTKAAQHWLTKRINSEEEKICAFIINPG